MTGEEVRVLECWFRLPDGSWSKAHYTWTSDIAGRSPATVTLRDEGDGTTTVVNVTQEEEEEK